MRPLNRREFMRLLGTGLLGAEMLRLLPFLPDETARGEGFPLAAVSSGTNADTPEMILRTALEGIGGIQRFVQPGMSVVVKPNATWAYPPHTASSTDPDLLRALIGMVRAAGAARITVLDHCSIDPGTSEALRVSGIGKVVEEEGVEGIFPDRTNAPLKTYTKIPLPDGKAFQALGVIKAALEADLRINLAVAKTHNVTKMTMCLKHMMGFLQVPGLLHPSLDQGIADLSAASSPIRAQLHILEALRVRLPYQSYRACAGPETDETNPAVVRRWNQIIAGIDPVLIDSYATITYFDMQPDELAYLRKASDSGVGAMDIEAALEDGRVKIFAAGQPVEAATPTLAPTETALVESNAVPTVPAAGPDGPAATSTPLPTATPLPEGSSGQPVGIAAGAAASCAPGSQVVDAGSVLGLALIPAALVVAGAGLVTAARVNREDPPDEAARPEGPSAQE